MSARRPPPIDQEARPDPKPKSAPRLANTAPLAQQPHPPMKTARPSSQRRNPQRPKPQKNRIAKAGNQIRSDRPKTQTTLTAPVVTQTREAKPETVPRNEIRARHISSAAPNEGLIWRPPIACQHGLSGKNDARRPKTAKRRRRRSRFERKMSRLLAFIPIIPRLYIAVPSERMSAPTSARPAVLPLAQNTKNCRRAAAFVHCFRSGDGSA
ncbi:hypothetical protein Msil_1774 [Methylocella silvestris BL2]|uniref:Uncharacterized protein n=1 Tax=Methylocella silvestris (strain DSM 15510 / CIP 108128 / LMG 27833 / NCIMB 13906 / BL2) TaxID=395965 RepID=B8ELT9_METSB|nr:hypothetical protein Msil_1774 [Methylocella silvestris BL2]